MSTGDLITVIIIGYALMIFVFSFPIFVLGAGEEEGLATQWFMVLLWPIPLIGFIVLGMYRSMRYFYREIRS